MKREKNKLRNHSCSSSPRSLRVPLFTSRSSSGGNHNSHEIIRTNGYFLLIAAIAVIFLSSSFSPIFFNNNRTDCRPVQEPSNLSRSLTVHRTSFRKLQHHSDTNAGSW